MKHVGMFISLFPNHMKYLGIVSGSQGGRIAAIIRDQQRGWSRLTGNTLTWLSGHGLLLE